MLLRNFSFCISVPWAISAGPTVLSVTKGVGAFARRASLNQMNCSTAPKPRPPNSSGQPTANQPSFPICSIKRL